MSGFLFWRGGETAGRGVRDSPGEAGRTIASGRRIRLTVGDEPPRGGDELGDVGVRTQLSQCVEAPAVVPMVVVVEQEAGRRLFVDVRPVLVGRASVDPAPL